MSSRRFPLLFCPTGQGTRDIASANQQAEKKNREQDGITENLQSI